MSSALGEHESEQTARPGDGRDAFTMAIVEEALLAVGDEMFVTTQRTSQTPLIYEVLDFCVGVTDANGLLVTQGNGITLFLGTMGGAVQSVVEKFGVESLRDGDVFITNDPYGGGGTHPSDQTLVMPVLHEGELVGFTCNKAHWIDMGGKDPGTVSTDTTEIYQEGLQLPCVKIFDAGILVDAVLDIIRANVRIPSIATGDLYAQVAAVRLGAARIQTLCQKYGVDVVREAMDRRLQHGAELARLELSKLPSGVYEAEDWIEGEVRGGGPYRIRVSVNVTPTALVCDFTGTAPELTGPLNCSRPALLSACRLIFKALTSPDAPLSDGSFAALEVVCPSRTLFTAERPAPISAYWETLVRASDLVWKALASIVPHRLTAGHFLSVTAELIVGKHVDTGDLFILFEPNAGGWGAGVGKDGERGLVAIGDGDTYILPVEVAEHQYGLLVEQYAYNVTEAGAGRWRGGEGIVKDYRITCDGATVSGFVGRHEYPPWGVEGGHDGSVNAIDLIPADGSSPRSLGMFSRIPVENGDIVRILTGSGGGWGDPLERDPDFVAADVREGFVSVATAESIYGVVIDPETFEVRSLTPARDGRGG